MSEVNRPTGKLNSIPNLPLTTVLESIPDAVIVADIATDEVIAVNDAAENLFDCQSDALVGLDVGVLHPDENKVAYKEAFRRAIDSGQVERLEDGSPIYIETRTNEHVPVEINTQCIQHQDRTLVLGVFRDISSRIEHQQQLEETKRRLETLLDAAPVPIAALDTDGRVQSWNQAAEETFGYSYDDIVGEPYPMFIDTAQFADLLDRILDGSILDGYEVVHRGKDGSRLHMELYARPLYDDDEITGIIGASVDITDRKRRRQGLQILHRVLRHDLRNKLTVIQGHASALLGEGDPDAEPTQEAAEQIVAATDDLAGLSTQVAQSRLLSDEPMAETEPLALRELRTTVESLLSDASDASIDMSAASDSVVIPEPAHSAVSQLLTHVTQYITEPAIEISLQVLDTDVQLTVRGQQPLLSDRHRELIRNGAETKLNHGLGLDIVKVYLTFVEIGADIQLIGEPTPETALRVTIPRLKQ